MMSRRSFVAGLLIGAALMAAIDEIVFHQILAWHHFYDRSTASVGLLSDGLLHSASLIALVAGLFIYAELRATHSFVRPDAMVGLFFGAGAFQLVDGLINHKLLRLHQVRYEVDLLPYDLIWNGGAILLLAVATVLLLRLSRTEGRHTDSDRPSRVYAQRPREGETDGDDN